MTMYVCENFKRCSRGRQQVLQSSRLCMSLRDRLTVVTVAATGDKDTLYSDLLRNSIAHYARVRVTFGACNERDPARKSALQEAIITKRSHQKAL